MNSQPEAARTRGTLARWGVLIAAVALTLTGCFRMDMALTINSDDSVSGKVTVAVSDEAAKSIGMTPDDILDQMDLDSSFGSDAASSEEYSQDGYTGRSYIFKETPLSDFSGTSSDELSIVREGDTFRVSGTMDLTSEGTGTDLDEYGAQGEALVKQMEITIAITFPGAVEEANGDIDGKTVSWHPVYGEKTEMTAVGSAKDGPAGKTDTSGDKKDSTKKDTKDVADNDSKDDSDGIPMWVWFAAGGGLLLLIVIIVVIVVVRGKKKKAAAANQGQPYQAGMTGVPGQQYPGQQPTQPYQQPDGYQPTQPYQQPQDPNAQPGQQYPGQQYPGQPYQQPDQPGGYQPTQPYPQPQDPNAQPGQQYPGQQYPGQQYPGQQPDQPGGYQPTQPYPQPQDPNAQPGQNPPAQ